MNAMPKRIESKPLALRHYQEKAVSALWQGFAEEDGNLLVVLPARTGKALSICEFTRRATMEYPETRSLIMTHSMELVDQNVKEMINLWPDCPLGICNAGLGQKDTKSAIIFGSIQSMHSKALALQRVDIIHVDEAQSIPRKEGTQWLKFFEEVKKINPYVRIAGWTATPFRLDSGRLDDGPDAMFKRVVYEYPVLDAIKEGYLVPPISQPSLTQIDTSHVGTRGGEFIPNQLNAAACDPEVVNAIADEMVEKGADRKTWVFFGSGVEHCLMVRDALIDRGITCEGVFATTPKAERKANVERFRRQEIRCLVSVNALAVGFNVKSIDLVGLGRPTQSTGFYIQAAMRGMTLHPEKENCIAEGQKVLTDHGLIPIENVTLAMKVWDGASFVRHCGAILRGEQEVITYAGLTATPDHKVWTKEGWKTLGWCASQQTPISLTGNGGIPVREADGHFRRGNQAGSKETRCVHDDNLYDLWEGKSEGVPQHKNWNGRLPEVRTPAPSAIVAGFQSYSSEVQMHESQRSSLGTLWWQRNQIPFCFTNSHGGLGAGESWSASPFGTGQGRQQRTLRTEQPAILNKIAESFSHKKDNAECWPSQIQGTVSKHQVCRQHIEALDRSWNDFSGNRGEVSQAIIQTKRRVWDILNCGPLHRFTIEGLLVHNCLILDWGGNIRRHGMLDQPQIKPKGKGGVGEMPVKVCQTCQAENFIAARECSTCGAPFLIVGSKIDTRASTGPLLSSQIIPEWCDVASVRYAAHNKPDKPTSLRVTYLVGLTSHSEWVTLQHQGYPRQKAEKWWLARASAPVPASVEEALARAKEIRKPTKILVKPVGRYTEIMNARFE